MRLVSRVFLSNLALQTDSSERVVMIQTFLALMEDEEKVKEEDRMLILPAIFRPSPTLHGSDDAAPPHWSAVYQKFLDKVTRS